MRRSLMFILIALLVVFMVASFYACADSDYGVLITDEEATVDGVVDIALTSVKNTYYLGEFFDRTKYTVKIVLDTGEVKEIAFDDKVKVTGFNSFVIGKNTFTVSYGAASTTYTVDIIEPKIASVVVATMPTKTEYIEGEKLDVSGCTLNLTLEGSGAIVNVGITSGFVTGFDSVEMGKKDLVINFCGTQILLKEAVEVRKKSLVAVSVAKMPENTFYLTNATFEKEGMVFLLTYDNDTTELLDVQGILESDLVFDYQFTSANSQSPVKIQYTTDVLGERKTFSMIIYCSVSDKLLRDTNPIEMVTSPSVGNELLEGKADMDYTGGKLRVYYQTGDSEILDMNSPIFTKAVYKDEAGTIATDLTKPGKYYVRFSYYRNDSLGWYYNMAVVVKEKTAISMTLTNTAEAITTKYYAGLDKKVNINSLKYILNYNNNTQSTFAITEDMMMEGSTLSTLEGAGNIDLVLNTIKLSYENYIIDNGVVKNITDGKTVGTIDTVNKSFTVDDDAYTYDDSGMVYGYKKIAFTKDGVSAVLKVKILKEEVLSIDVNDGFNNAFVDKNATSLDGLTGLKLRVKYNHGGEKTVVLGQDEGIKLTFSDGTSNPSVFVKSLDGKHYKTVTLYISYKDCSTSVDGQPITIDAHFTDINVSASGSIVNPPTVAYIYGDKVSVLGMIFTVDMSGTTKRIEVVGDDNTSKTVLFMIDDNSDDIIELSKSAFVCSDNYAVTNTGDYKFNYFGAVFSTVMTVTPLSVSSITVKDTHDVKTVYNVGERFLGLDGIELSSVKNNGLSESVYPTITKINSQSEMYANGYYYIFDGAENTSGVKVITIYYKENNNVVKVDYRGVVYKDVSYTIASLTLYNENGETTSLGSVAAGMSINLAQFKLHIRYEYEGQYAGEAIVDVESSMLYYEQGNITEDEERPVTLTYGGIQLKNLTVKVVKTNLSYIEVNYEQLQQDYIVGSTFSYEGGYIIRHYDAASGLDSDRVPLAEGKVTGFNSNVAFNTAQENITQTLTVEYGDKKATFKVTIWNKRTPSVSFSNTDVRFGTGADPMIKINAPEGVDIFEEPTYTIRYQFMLPNGTWKYIDENNSSYNYYIGKVGDSWVFDNSQKANSYQTRNRKPHHVGTYRIVFNTEGNEYYNAVKDESIVSLFNINPYQITIVAQSQVVYYGDAMPKLGYSVAGNSTVWDFALNTLGVYAEDNELGNLALNTPAIDAGTYKIERGTFDHPYFNITFESSTYTVKPASITVTPVDLENIHFTDDFLGDTILFDVRAGNVVKDGLSRTELSQYFTVTFTKDYNTTTDIKEKGVYTMTLTAVKGSEGEYNYAFIIGETTTYVLSYTFEVRRKIREFTADASNVTVVTDGDNYIFTFDFKDYADLDSLGWTTSILDGGFTEDNTIGKLADVGYQVVIAKSDVTDATYQRFLFKYFATEEYEESVTSIIVEVPLP